LQEPTGKKIALVTGATSGIGAAYAHALGERGYDLIITGRRRDVIEGVAHRIEKQSKAKVTVVIAELSERKDLDQLLDVIKKIGRVDFLVNNAGFTTKGLYYQTEISEQENMVNVHAISMMKLTHAVLPGMIERNNGTIINVSSVQAFTPMALSVTYTSIKAFMRNFSVSLHCEVKNHGIKVQCLMPGFTRTDLGRGIGVDMGRIKDAPMMHWMLPEEVVRISLDDLRKKNKVLCVPGFGNKALYALTKFMPERMWYKMAEGIVQKMP